MFGKIYKTQYPPLHKGVLIWDGQCGFCKYWVTRWHNMTGDTLDYLTFQDASVDFPDIPLKEFKKASRIIEPDGRVYSGPDSAYRSYDYAKKGYPWHAWYLKSPVFRWISDHAYNWIAKHRSFMFKVTVAFFGRNPLSLKPYWLIYLILVFAVVLLCLKLF